MLKLRPFRFDFPDICNRTREKDRSSPQCVTVCGDSFGSLKRFDYGCNEGSIRSQEVTDNFLNSTWTCHRSQPTRTFIVS